MAIQIGQQMTYHAGTIAEYKAKKAAGQLVANDLYFITDTKELYIGEEKYFEPTEVVNEFPETGAQGKLYIQAQTFEAKIFNGTEWVLISPAIVTTLDDQTEAAKLVTAKAIRDYVASKVSGGINEVVKSVAYDEVAQKFTVAKGDGSSEEILLKNLVTKAAYNAETAVLTFSVANGDAIEINMPKENFLESANYNEVTHDLELTLVDGSVVRCNLAELIDVYTAEATSSVDMRVEGNKFTANVKISTKEHNAIQLIEEEGKQGLFVEIPDTALVKSVEDSATVGLEVSPEGALKANAKVSAEAGNKLSAKADGLFVEATDLSAYYDKNAMDALLEAKADKSDTYTKAEVDAKFQWKAI